MTSRAFNLDLVAQFTDRLREISRAAEELGHSEAAFNEMLERHGSISAVEKLIVSGDIQAGLRFMIRAGRPDLTVEYVVCEARFRSLFPAAVRAAARWRLHCATQCT